MKQTEKIMVACLFLSEGYEPEHVRQFICALEEDLASGDEEASSIVAAALDRCTQLKRNHDIFGDVIALMMSKRRLDELYARLDMQLVQVTDICKLLSNRTDTSLAAKIVLKQLHQAVGLQQR